MAHYDIRFYDNIDKNDFSTPFDCIFGILYIIK